MSTLVISPAQALLLLIKHYKTNLPTRVADIEALTSLYVEGVRNPSERLQLKSYFDQHKADVLQKYTVSASHSEINNDPSRRYFESQLLLATLRSDSNLVDINILIKYVKNLEAFLDAFEPQKYAEATVALEGNYTGDNNLYSEYSEYMKRINEGRLFSDSQGFDATQRLTFQLLIRASFLAVNCALSATIRDYDPMPINIYETGIYEAKNKGKLALSLEPEFSGKTRNQHYGLMKGHMPVNRDDMLLADASLPHIKPSDQATYDINAQWPRINFYRLVHPYSNSISGTVLCQLRALAYFQQKGVGAFLGSNNQFMGFFKLFISTLGFYGGGHSLFEFTYPLSLQAVSDEFQFTGIDFSQMNILNLFSFNNTNTIGQALDAAISYNERYLKLKELQTQLKEYNVFNNCGALNLLATKKIQSHIVNGLDNFINDTYIQQITSEDNKKLLNRLMKEIENHKFDEAIATSQELEAKIGCGNFFAPVRVDLTTLHNYYNSYNLRLFFVPVSTEPVVIEKEPELTVNEDEVGDIVVDEEVEPVLANEEVEVNRKRKLVADDEDNDEVQPPAKKARLNGPGSGY